MEIFTRPPTAQGPAATFTGDVWVDGLYAGPAEQARLSVVRFAPSARSHRHSHRLGRFSTSSRASRCSAAATERSSRAAPGTRSAPPRVRSTGTAPHPTGSWPIWS